jgi:hypothetical protein
VAVAEDAVVAVVAVVVAADSRVDLNKVHRSLIPRIRSHMTKPLRSRKNSRRINSPWIKSQSVETTRHGPPVCGRTHPASSSVITEMMKLPKPKSPMARRPIRKVMNH